MATVSIPITGWWGGSHALKRQKMQVTAAENERADQSEMLKIRMHRAWNDLLDAQTLYQQSHDQFVEAFAQYEIKKANICRPPADKPRNFIPTKREAHLDDAPLSLSLSR